jgi:peptide/nickel transport system substrate-binding protein
MNDSSASEVTNAELLHRNDPDMPFPYVLPEPRHEPRVGGILRIAWHQDLVSLDPTFSTSAGTLMLPNLITNRLLRFTGGGGFDPFERRLEPELATSWERSPDGLTYSFQLAKGVHWQNVLPTNGRLLVAEDVCWALERYGREGVHKGYLAAMASCEALDQHTVTITLQRPQADFDIPLGSRSFSIYPRELVDTGTIENINQQSIFVGSGPFILEEVVPGSHIQLRRNPDYWEGDVYLDGLKVFIEPDAERRLDGFRAGSFDYISNPFETLSEALILHKAYPATQLHLVPVFSSQWGLALNLADDRFADERVRQALMLAIDRDALADELHEGLAKVLPSTPWVHLFDREPKDLELGPWLRHDPGEARRMLAATSVLPLNFELCYRNYHDAMNRRANERIVEQFAAIGVTLRLNELDMVDFNHRWSGNDYGDAADGYAPAGFTADAYFNDSLVTGGPLNRWGISDPEIDGWAERQSCELDVEARHELLRRIWDQMLDRAYRIEKVGALRFEIYQPWLRNLRLYDATGDLGLQIARVWLDSFDDY